MESNAVTVRLLQCLEEFKAARDALLQIAGEIGMDEGKMLEIGEETLTRLVENDIILASIQSPE